MSLTLGGVPFEGPLACVRIGRNMETGEFIVNPTFEERENSDLDLTIAGTADYISMVEAGAEEISEDDMLAAMTFGQEAIGAFCEAQQRFLEAWRTRKRSIVPSPRGRARPSQERISPITTRCTPLWPMPTSSAVSPRSRRSRMPSRQSSPRRSAPVGARHRR